MTPVKLYFSCLCSDISAPFQNLTYERMQNTLIVWWDHDYYLCRNFTVYLNDIVVSDCTNITTSNCEIRNVDAGLHYEVTVVAAESDTKPVNASLTVTASAIASIGSSM